MCILDIIIDGMSVRDICAKYNIPEKNIVDGHKRQRSIKRLNKYSDEELVRALLKNQLKGKVIDYKRKYIIGGLTIAEYACKYRLIVQSLRDHIRRGLEDNPNANIEDLAYEFVLITRKNEKQPDPLMELCKSKRVSFKVAYTIYTELYANRNDISKEQAYEIIVDFLVKKRLEKRRKLARRRAA